MKFLFTVFTVVVFIFSATADEKKNNETVADKPILLIVNGTVSDEATGELLIGVEVKLEGTDKKTYTDFDGNFYFDEVAPGEYSIMASYISYEKNTIEKKKIDIFSNKINVKLKPAN